MYYETNPRKGTPEMVGDPMPNQVFRGGIDDSGEGINMD